MKKCLDINNNYLMKINNKDKLDNKNNKFLNNYKRQINPKLNH